MNGNGNLRGETGTGRGWQTEDTLFFILFIGAILCGVFGVGRGKLREDVLIKHQENLVGDGTVLFLVVQLDSKFLASVMVL